MVSASIVLLFFLGVRADTVPEACVADQSGERRIGQILLQTRAASESVAHLDEEVEDSITQGVGSYGFISRACVTGYNTLMRRGQSLDACKRLCDQRSTCKSFEYGHNHGGGGYGRDGDCQLNSASNPSGCDGSHYNFDLYLKTSSISLYEYTKIDYGCVSGSNLEMIHNSNVRECEIRCDATKSCKSFEFGVNHGGSGYGRANDCHLQTGDNPSGCDGGKYNFDLYRRVRRVIHVPTYNVKGEWVPLFTIPSAMERTWTVGSSRTDGQELSSSVTLGLTTSLGSGFVTAGMTFEMSLSESMSTSITKEESQETVMKFAPSSKGDFLWQWYFKFEERGALIAKTKSREFAMTSGLAKPPRCLPGYFDNCQFHGAQDCGSNVHQTII